MRQRLVRRLLKNLHDLAFLLQFGVLAHRFQERLRVGEVVFAEVPGLAGGGFVHFVGLEPTLQTQAVPGVAQVPPVFEQVDEAAEAPEVVVEDARAVGGLGVVGVEGDAGHQFFVDAVAQFQSLFRGVEAVAVRQAAKHGEGFVPGVEFGVAIGGVVGFEAEFVDVDVLDDADDEALEEASALIGDLAEFAEEPVLGGGAHDAEGRAADVFVDLHLGDVAVLAVEHVGDLLLHTGVVGLVHLLHPGGEFHVQEQSVGIDA